MKLCTKCNRVLQDGDTHCPYCAGLAAGSADLAETAPDTESLAGEIDAMLGVSAVSEISAPEPAEAPEAALEIPETVPEPQTNQIAVSATGAFTIEIPLGEVRGLLDADVADAAGAVAEPKRDNKKPQKILAKSPKYAPAAEIAEAEFPFEKIPDYEVEILDASLKGGLVEQELAEAPVPEAKPRISKLGVTLVAVLVVAVLVFAGIITVELIQASKPPDEAFYIDMLAGTWVGDEFVYEDDVDKTRPMRELLTISPDGTFTLQYLVVNSAVPDGYLDGEWEVDEEFSGVVKVLTDNLTLALVYESDSEKLVFLRDFIEFDENRIVLREYFDKERTAENSYDTILKRAQKQAGEPQDSQSA